MSKPWCCGEISELGKLTPAEWRAGEGVVVMDIVARRLRGHPRALLHGNGEVGERSAGRLVGCGPQRRNGAVAVGFVQRNGGSRNSKYLRTKERTRQRRLTLPLLL
jgi:hypothetical protein